MKTYIPLWLITLVLLVTSSCEPASTDWQAENTGDDAEVLILTTPPPPPNTPLCMDEQPPFITGFEVLQPLQLEEPAARLPFRDPVFGSCMVRLTDRAADLSSGDSSPGLKNEYSRVQSFNADGSLLLARGVDATWYLYASASLQPLGQVPIDVEPRWSASDPSLIYFIRETSLMSYNLLLGTTNIIHDFSLDFPKAVMVWTRYEGSPSAHSRYWGLMAEDENWLVSYYIVYDLQKDQVIASRDLRSWSEESREIDSVTISPLGNYFLVQMDKYCQPGQLGTDSDPCGLMIYDRDLSKGRGLLRIVGHSDTALDASGREVFVYQDIDTDQLSVLDLQSGHVTPLLTLDFSHTPFGLHISGRSFETPGWVIISTHDGDPVNYTWMDDSIFAVEIKPGGHVARLAHTRSLVDESMEHDYWAEPQATVNTTLTRILFTTNWGRSGTGEVEMFMIDLPIGWINQLP